MEISASEMVSVGKMIETLCLHVVQETSQNTKGNTVLIEDNLRNCQGEQLDDLGGRV